MQSICSAEGCERTDSAHRGMCGMHYKRMWDAGLAPKRVFSPSVRLAARLVPMPNGCVEWVGSRRHGYGQISVDGHMTGTHRLAWELVHGPIPPGLEILHSCDNPPCCNVEHLSVGSHADNMADKAAKGRHQHSDRTHCKRGHEVSPRQRCPQCRTAQGREYRLRKKAS